MKVIKATTFQNSMLTSTTATNAYSNWSSGTTYAINNRVTYNNKTYESLQNSNLNKQPDTNPTWWLLIGADNKHAMFDQTVSTGTTAGTSLTVVLAPGTIDSLALINLDCEIVTITVKDAPGGTVVYTYTGGLSGVTVGDWYQYFFYDPLLKRTQLVFQNIPPYATCEVTLVFTRASGTISVGECVFGLLTNIGDTQYGATAGIIDFSKKSTDDFGNITFVERPYSKRMSSRVMVSNVNLNRVQQLLYSLRATPSVWIGSDDALFEEALVVYGFYKDFSMEIAYPSHSICSLEVEGLT